MFPREVERRTYLCTHLTCHFRTVIASRAGAGNRVDYFHLSGNKTREDCRRFSVRFSQLSLLFHALVSKIFIFRMALRCQKTMNGAFAKHATKYFYGDGFSFHRKLEQPAENHELFITNSCVEFF